MTNGFLFYTLRGRHTRACAVQLRVTSKRFKTIVFYTATTRLKTQIPRKTLTRPRIKSAPSSLIILYCDIEGNDEIVSV